MDMISIIIPVYNAKKSINNCLNSILAQTYDNIEIIIVDDESDDGSAEVCDRYAEQYKNISTYHIKNKGVSNARNFGLSKASGDYIMFCDSDDVVEKTWCESLYKAISNYPESWVMCGASYVDSNTQDVIKTIVYDENTELSSIEKQDYYKVFALGVSGYIWNHIYDLSVIKKNNIQFDENTDYAEDALFNNEYLKYCESICFINKPLYNYYVSSSSGLSHKYFPDYYDKLKKIYLSRKQFIDKKYLPEFCYEYFYHFNLSLDNTLDKRNKDSFLKKLKYNNYVINDAVFKDCLDNMIVPQEDEKYVRLLKKGNYYLIFLRNKL